MLPKPRAVNPENLVGVLTKPQAVASKGPYWGGSFQWGDNEPHCYAGKIPPGQTRRCTTRLIFAAHMRDTVPEGADVTSWMK